MSSKGGDVKENWLFEFEKQNLNCLNFDGVNDRVDFGDILETYLNFTIEFWINPDKMQTMQVPQTIMHHLGLLYELGEKFGYFMNLETPIINK